MKYPSFPRAQTRDSRLEMYPYDVFGVEARLLTQMRLSAENLSLLESQEHLSLFFDRQYYLDTNTDVAQGEINPLRHYLESGIFEGRVGTAAEERWLAVSLLASGLVELPAGISNREDAVEFGIASLRGDVSPQLGVRLDRVFIQNYYPYSRLGHRSQLTLYAELFRSGHPLFLTPELEQSRAELVADGQFDIEQYRYDFILPDEGISNDVDPIIYYLTEGWRRFCSPAYFDDRFYLETYPDILRAKVQPLLHYTRHGRREGRISRSSLKNRPQFAELISARKPTLLVVMHDCSRTGAPLLALRLCRQLSQHYSIIGLVLRGGDLEPEFREACSKFEVIGTPENVVSYYRTNLQGRSEPVAILVNTYACGDVVSKMRFANKPTVLLVHDFADYLRPAYLAPRNIVSASRVVFSAAAVYEASRAVSVELGFPLNAKHIDLVHQDVIPNDSDVKEDVVLTAVSELRAEYDRNGQALVIGAGTIEPRKAPDLLLDLAAFSRARTEAFQFRWIGKAGRPAESDRYQVFLDAQLRLRGVRREHFLLGETKVFSRVLEKVDALFLSSLLDPFPNVAIDALVAGLPVICFDKGNGIEALRSSLPGAVFVVPYRDTAAAYEVLEGLDLSKEARELRRIQAEKYFSSFSYPQKIAEIIAAAVESHSKELIFDQGVDFDRLQTSAAKWFLPQGTLVTANYDELISTGAAISRSMPDLHATTAGQRAGEVERRGPNAPLRISGLSSFGQRPLVIEDLAGRIQGPVYFVTAQKEIVEGLAIVRQLRTQGVEVHSVTPEPGETSGASDVLRDFNPPTGAIVIAIDAGRWRSADVDGLSRLIAGAATLALVRGPGKVVLSANREFDIDKLEETAKETPFSLLLDGSPIYPALACVVDKEDKVWDIYRVLRRWLLDDDQAAAPSRLWEGIERLVADGLLWECFERSQWPAALRRLRPKF